MSARTDRRDEVVSAALRWYLSGSPTVNHTAALARACRDLIDTLGPPGLLCLGCDGVDAQHQSECPRNVDAADAYARSIR